MPDGEPFPPERLRDTQFEEVVRGLCARPSMYMASPTFGSVCAYLSGFDAARGHGPLLGFREWLIVRSNGGNNLTWEGLALRALSATSEAADRSSDEARLIQALGSLIEAYCCFRYVQGITKVYYDYGRWLLRHRWYRGPLRKRRDENAEPGDVTG